MAGAGSVDGLVKTREKWGAVTAGAGFTIVPNHLLVINQFVDKEKAISPTEMFVLMHILSAWWSAERLPFPSKATIANRAGLSARQVQRALSSLEEKGYLERVARYGEDKGRRSSNYDIAGLVSAVAELAEKHPKLFRGKAAKEGS